MKYLDAPRFLDSEDSVHFIGPGQAVNAALCGSNDVVRRTGWIVNCKACLSIVDYVADNLKTGRAREQDTCEEDRLDL